ncbi:hypothetical protein T484DRAFT_1793683 [Baffinella frigidus]|nr:hypothetical protein T484DRAFT_1793683 [Cryptophyta sp. CCMP2293]
MRSLTMSDSDTLRILGKDTLRILILSDNDTLLSESAERIFCLERDLEPLRLAAENSDALAARHEAREREVAELGEALMEMECEIEAKVAEAVEGAAAHFNDSHRRVERYLGRTIEELEDAKQQIAQVEKVRREKEGVEAKLAEAHASATAKQPALLYGAAKKTALLLGAVTYLMDNQSCCSDTGYTKLRQVVRQVKILSAAPMNISLGGHAPAGGNSAAVTNLARALALTHPARAGAAASLNKSGTVKHRGASLSSTAKLGDVREGVVPPGEGVVAIGSLVRRVEHAERDAARFEMELRIER